MPRVRSLLCPRSNQMYRNPPVPRTARPAVGTRLFAGRVSQTSIDSGSCRRRRPSLTNELRRSNRDSKSFPSQLIYIVIAEGLRHREATDCIDARSTGSFSAPASFRQDLCRSGRQKLMRGSLAIAASAWTTTPAAPLRKRRLSEMGSAGHRYRISPRGAVREWRS